jgi:peptidoglycan/LPS O-acetylase OafA/YrhL
MNFRKDINGLRAIAVIAVVLFHFNAYWLPGGFAGVDVFFVISGFLMTSIIFRRLEQDKFSIMHFYVARANRIIPALAFLCVCLLIFGWFYLIPSEYKLLSKHAATSIGFLSNIAYMRESGYFDLASHQKWLLHTWSLSAEWQFYILYPAILVVMKRYLSTKTMQYSILNLTVIGFILCAYGTINWPDASYYMLPTRAWEMLLGGVAYFFPLNISSEKRKFISMVGLTCILLSYVCITENDPWPGYLALMPVLGTYLVIQAHHTHCIITGNKPLQYIGSWSYSIYLWHWPICVLINKLSSSFDPNILIIIGVLSSIFFGFLSYSYIEKISFVNSYNKISDYLKCVPLQLSFIIGLICTTIYYHNGVEERFNKISFLKKNEHLLKMPLRTNHYCFYSFNDGQEKVSLDAGTRCFLGEKANKSSTLLFGDSFAGHNEPLFNLIFKEIKRPIQSITTNWCIASFEKNFTGPKSHKAYEQCLLNRKFLKDNMHKYKNLILAGSWDSALQQDKLESFMKVVKTAANMNIKVFIMAAPTRFSNIPLDSFRYHLYGLDYFAQKNILTDKLQQSAHLILASLAAQHKNVYFIDRSLLFESNDHFNIDGYSVPYSLDGSHISILGSIHSGKHFMASKKSQQYIKAWSSK